MMSRTNTFTRQNHGLGAPAAAVVVLLAGSLAACATKPFGEDTRERMDAVLEDSLRAVEAAPPREVTDALLPAEGPAWAEPAREERFDVQVRNVRAEDFFMGLVEDTPHNMVVHPEVTGTISLNLRNVTIPQVMEAVSEVYGYEYRELAGGWLVLPAGLHTRVFQVDYLTMSREGSSCMRVASGQIGLDDVVIGILTGHVLKDADAVVRLFAPNAILLGTVSPDIASDPSAFRNYFARLPGSGNKVVIGERRTFIL
jgi:hypothetical protein